MVSLRPWSSWLELPNTGVTNYVTDKVSIWMKPEAFDRILIRFTVHTYKLLAYKKGSTFSQISPPIHLALVEHFNSRTLSCQAHLIYHIILSSRHLAPLDDRSDCSQFKSTNNQSINSNQQTIIQFVQQKSWLLHSQQWPWPLPFWSSWWWHWREQVINCFSCTVIFVYSYPFYLNLFI